jgi:hypothetical protein
VLLALGIGVELIVEPESSDVPPRCRLIRI